MPNLGRYPLQLGVTRHKNGKFVPVRTWAGPEGSSSWRLPEFIGSWHVKVARLSVLRTLRLYSPGDKSRTLSVRAQVSKPRPATYYAFRSHVCQVCVCVCVYIYTI